MIYILVNWSIKSVISQPLCPVVFNGLHKDWRKLISVIFDGNIVLIIFLLDTKNEFLFSNWMGLLHYKALDSSGFDFDFSIKGCEGNIQPIWERKHVAHATTTNKTSRHPSGLQTTLQTHVFLSVASSSYSSRSRQDHQSSTVSVGLFIPELMGT